MIKWEYLKIYRHRGFNGSFTGTNYASEWDENIDLDALGQKGWELVAISPRSGVGGEHWAGATSEELWVFKRPLE